MYLYSIPCRYYRSEVQPQYIFKKKHLLKKGLSIELNVNLKVHLHFASKMKTKKSY